ncbi:MAG: radical SAM protein [Thermodesulfobacteriota bacterium]
MKICLINPVFPSSLWDFSGCRDLSGYEFPFPPLSLMTLAGLTPNGHGVRILDENTASLDFDIDAALVGITGYHIQKERAFAIADEFRERGVYAVIGGSLVSESTLEECLQHADAVFLGEAERTWPIFLAEFSAGRPKKIYKEDTLVSMSLSPLPRFELVSLEKYSTAMVETSRGCPYGCEFCEIPSRLGKLPRAKPIEAVMEEVKKLHCLGVDSIFFIDDNFIGSRERTIRLLKELIAFVKSVDYKMYFTCQFTLNNAVDTELLGLFREANFKRVFMGLETPRSETLKRINKRQNLSCDPVKAVHAILSHGIIVWGSFIVGFDGDTPSIFGEQLKLIEDANIPVAMVGLLQALPGTPLYERMKKEGRLEETEAGGIRGAHDDLTRTNIAPIGMTKEELVIGYERLIESIYEETGFGRRLIAAIRRDDGYAIKSRARLNKKNVLSLLRILRYYLLTIDIARSRMFLRVMAEVIFRRPGAAFTALTHLAVYKHFKAFYRKGRGRPLK